MNYTNDDHDVLLFVTINIVLFIVTLKQQKRRTMSGTNMDGNWNRSACLRGGERHRGTGETSRTQNKDVAGRVGGMKGDDARQGDKKQKQVEKSEPASTFMV